VARDTNGARDSRHHLSHIELFHPSDIPRFRELGAVANFQPLWAMAETYITDLTLPILPPETHRWIYPIGSVLRSGAVVAFGSDWSVSSVNPLEEIEVAVRRADWRKPDVAPFLPDERIDLRDAIAAFTINSAYVNFQDDRTGSIEPGKLADLIARLESVAIGRTRFPRQGPADTWVASRPTELSALGNRASAVREFTTAPIGRCPRTAAGLGPYEPSARRARTELLRAAVPGVTMPRAMDVKEVDEALEALTGESVREGMRDGYTRESREDSSGRMTFADFAEWSRRWSS
jgi:hypothetical protein